MLSLKNISKNIQENVKKMKAGPQNRRFPRVTCTRVSNALRWIKYLQQMMVIKLKECATQVQYGEKFQTWSHFIY